MFPLAIPFKLNNKDIDDTVSEFNITYNNSKNSFEKLLEFIDMYSDKRINIEIEGDFPKGIVTSLNKVSNNIYIRLTGTNIAYFNDLKESGIRFFLDKEYPVYNLATLDNLIQMGVTDIYPVDDLLYNIKYTKDYCDAHNVNMRLVLNTIPASTFDRGVNYKSQIYRPQDIDFLSQYFDCFEFECGKPYDWAKFDVLYRAWFVRKGWNGDLSEINDNLNIPFPNLTIAPELTEVKSKCGRRCNSRPTNQCDKCNQFVELGLTLQDKGVYLRGNKRR